MTKQYDIPRRMFVEAWRQVKSNKGAAGVDGETIAEFERDLQNNLYKIWNRMCSGSYFPPAVKAVEIPKGNGKMRQLGIPTVSDRVAQSVVKMHIEPIVERKFHPDSYGYRPGRSQQQAVARAKRRCWKYDWVLEVDIKGFFDNIDHDLMMETLGQHVQEKWILLYVNRWLKAETQRPNGTKETKEKGSPQGSVISPILSNIFLHHAFDEWMRENYPNAPFERYADDLIMHCESLEHATAMAQAVTERLREWKLEINTEKTRIVYCKDSGRPGNHEHVSFTFLGFTFKPRRAKNRQTGEVFTSFLPAISHKAQLTIFEEIRKWQLHKRTEASLMELKRDINMQMAGWFNYYGSFYPSALDALKQHIDYRILRWSMRKYKKLTSERKARGWLTRLRQRYPQIFAHWRFTARIRAV